LVARRGGVPLLAPALREVPDIEPHRVLELLAAWRLQPYRLVIFQTGVGTRALVRGPKPLGELNSRRVRIDFKAPSPFTTDTVLATIAGIDLHEARVLVQRYGAANEPLRQALETRGAAVDEIATYRWALPDDVQPLLQLLDALASASVDAVVFTSAVQIHNLHAVAQSHGRAAQLVEQLTGPVIASIGPVCTRALAAHGITTTVEAEPPKLGPLVVALEAALTARG
jgi:uroporphyrinogen-III synthase